MAVLKALFASVKVVKGFCLLAVLSSQELRQIFSLISLNAYISMLLEHRMRLKLANLQHS